jgi:prepilin-type N-terminal cleavage/methylation domain-containing protein
MDRSRVRKFGGFTLIEILVVIAIIGILVSVGMYGYNIALQNSRDQQRLANVNSIANALGLYYNDNKAYPTMSTNSKGDYIFNASFQLDQPVYVSTCGLSDPSKNFLAPNYIASIPQDPSNKFTDCSGTDPIGQYLYTAVTDSKTDSTSPQSFELMAKMEKTTNMSTSEPDSGQEALSSNNYYYSVPKGLSSLNLCIESNNNSGCVSNYYLGPKIGD